MTEHWRPIAGWEGFYEVSDRARVRSLDRVIIRSDGRPYRAKGRVLCPQRHRGAGW
jgi:NUMOD4 motif